MISDVAGDISHVNVIDRNSLEEPIHFQVYKWFEFKVIFLRLVTISWDQYHLLISRERILLALCEL